VKLGAIVGSVRSAVAGPLFLAFGPVFTKELRVTSRRLRFHALRLGYLALLAVFVALVWMAEVRWFEDQSSAYNISRMAQAGKDITASIVRFQFYSGQLLAVILLSTSISGEIYQRTLGVLMTTPITAFQIVFGKLASKLLQLVILLLVSLPLLAIVRVFGGVPMDYVLAAVSITLTACVFAGSVTIFFSVLFRRAYASILLTFAAMFVLYVLLPAVMGLILLPLAVAAGPDVMAVIMAVIYHTNPTAALEITTAQMLRPSGIPVPMSWPLHCLIMLAASGGVLALCVLLVRKYALRSAISGAGIRTGRAVGLAGEPTMLPVANAPLEGQVRRVGDRPVIWREMRSPLFRTLATRLVGTLIPACLMALVYLACATADVFDEEGLHAALVSMFVALGACAVSILAATSITLEKEAQTLGLLLTTPLSDARIIFAKAVGVLRRCAPVWFPLVAHLLLFTLVGLIHPIVTIHLGMIVTSVMVFTGGMGLYFGARLRRTATAVVMNLGTALAIWLILPILVGTLGEISGPEYEDAVLQACWMPNPVVQAWVVTDAASGDPKARWDLSMLDYYWPDRNIDTVGETTSMLLILMVGYVAAGLLFAWRAKCRLRRSPF